MQQQANNPYLEREDFFAGYNKSIDELKKDPTLIELSRLHYELFEMNPAGKRCLELWIERYVMPALVNRGQPTYQLDVLWQEGFKDAFRMIRNTIFTYKQQMKAEVKAS